MPTATPITGTAAGVPFLAVAPAENPDTAPLIIVWHLMDPPCSEAAMAAALPLDGLNAWRVYLGLPMSGARAPEGGQEAVMRLGMDDAVLNLFGPITGQAVSEFPAALVELRHRLGIADGPVYVVGGSAGGMIALEVLARADVLVAAAAVVNPVSRLAPLIAANARLYGIDYSWSEASRSVARHYDYVRRAEELSSTEILVVTGGEDDVSITEPAAALVEALGEWGTLVTIDGMGHALAEAPGLDAAPQTADAARVDAEITDWLRDRLPA